MKSDIPQTASHQQLIDMLGLEWTAPKEVQTKRGPRIVLNAEPNEAFYNAWRNENQMLRDLGLSLSRDLYKDPSGNTWRVTWWQELDPAVLAQRNNNLTMSRAASSDFDPPRPPGLNYYPFQRAGIQFCLDKPGALIGDDMGLGKTIQCIGLINCDETIQRVLIVTKASLKDNWKAELEKWLVRPMNVEIAKGQYWPKHANCVVINYDILSKHYHALRAQQWDLCALDEAQNIRNWRTVRAKNIIGYKPSKKKLEQGETPMDRLPARRRLALSGTPIENHIEDLWSTLNFLDPDKWGSFYGYAKKYCGATSNGYGMETTGASALDKLQTILRSTLMIRRLKSQVLTELPPKTRSVVSMSTEGLEHVIAAEQEAYEQYEEEIEDAQVQIELARADDNPDAFRETIKRLQGARFAFTEIARIRHETAVAKVPRMIEMLKEEMEDCSKVLFFAHHGDVIGPIAAEFPGSVTITGSTPAGDRQGICNRFQQDPACRNFFGSIRACGEGLNLQAANLVIFGEEDWVPSKISQCEDRAHRIGSKGNVLVKHYILPGTIDSKMIKTWLTKQEVIEQALDIEPTAAAEPVVAPYQPVGKRKELLDEGLLITSSQRAAILYCLQTLSQMCDGARSIDGMGFSKIDVRIGKDLAMRGYLTPGQAAMGRRICRKYVRQLGREAVEAMG